jgi:hypothetical protein
MNASVAPEPALGSEVAAEPIQSAPSPEDANSGAAPDPAGQDVQAPAPSGVDAGSPTASDDGRRSAQHRIEELSAEKRAALDAAEFWRTRALSTTPTPPPAQAPQAAPEPTLDQFEYDTAKWAAAYSKWAKDTIKTETAQTVTQQLQKVRAEEAEAAVEEQWAARRDEFAKTTPGAIEAITIAGQIVPPFLGGLIKSSPHGPKVAVHLGLNPDKAARIARLPPAQQAVHFGRLEAELSAAPAPARKPTPPPSTRAPAPPSPVGSNAPSKPIESMTISEYMEDRASRRKLTRA